MTNRRNDASLASRVRAFFVDNPDEEMTYELLVTKFDAPMATIRNIVSDLREAGLIESVHVIRNRAKGIAS